ncbi:MAG: mechanosensitive ion channel family protein [Proteobacteria bacterium]|nr:mechanosensitive ion channel family protein [Pseudomonadota bacterium]
MIKTIEILKKSHIALIKKEKSVMSAINETEVHNPLSLLNICSKALEGSYGPLIQTLGIVFFVLIFNFFIKALLIKLRTRFGNQHKVWALSFVSALHKPLSYFVWFVAALCALDTVISSLFTFHLANIHLILSIGAILSFGWFLLRLNNELVHYMMEMSQSQKISLTPSKLDLIGKIATISVIFVTIFLLMDVTGRNMQTLIAFGGIGGLALAFASQQVVSNFFGGLMIYITQPFTIGEWVNLPERQIEGHIEEIGWYLTRIRSFDKRPIYVPNSVFTQTIVITPSRMSHERFHYTIGLRYRDIKVVKPIIDNIKLMLLKHPSVDHQLSTDVFFKNFGASALDIEISAYVSITANARFPAVRQDILLKIADIVSQEGAEIATPTNIVELHGGLMMKQHPELVPATQTT